MDADPDTGKNIYSFGKNNIFNSHKTKNLPAICHFLFHRVLQSYSTHSPEFLGPKFEEIFFIIVSLIFEGSGIIILDPERSSGSMRTQIRNTTRMNKKKFEKLSKPKERNH